MSRALGDAAPALAELAGQPDKDLGHRVRARRQELGLPVATPGTSVTVALAITSLPAPDLLDGELLQADEAEPCSAFRCTEQEVQVRWSSTTQFAMVEAADLQIGALVRVRGTLGERDLVEAERLVILTRVARIIEA